MYLTAQNQLVVKVEGFTISMMLESFASVIGLSCDTHFPILK